LVAAAPNPNNAIPNSEDGSGTDLGESAKAVIPIGRIKLLSVKAVPVNVVELPCAPV
jgi:hypothetical protein